MLKWPAFRVWKHLRLNLHGLTATLIAFWNPLIESRSLSITWINPMALTVGIVVGCIVSLRTGREQGVKPTTDN